MKQIDEQFLQDLSDMITCITFAIKTLEERIDKLKDKGEHLHMSNRIKSQNREFIASINRILKDQDENIEEVDWSNLSDRTYSEMMSEKD